MSGPRSVILIGLSGAGKSTIAHHVAEILGSPWADLDSVIVERVGKSIEQIFAENGEAHFRELERNEMAALLNDGPQVIASGAGWAVQAGAFESVQGKAFVVHLMVDPKVAAGRLQGTTDRPLLAGDIETRLKAQLAEREAHYKRADVVIGVGTGTPETIAQGVAVAARLYGGWAGR